VFDYYYFCLVFVVVHYAGNWNGTQERFSLVCRNGRVSGSPLMRSLSSAEHVVRSSVLAVASLQPRTGWHEKAADFATCGVAVSTRLPGLSLGEDRPCAASCLLGLQPRRTYTRATLAHCRRGRRAAPAPAKRGTQQLAKGALTNARRRRKGHDARSPLPFLPCIASLGASGHTHTHFSREQGPDSVSRFSVSH
jgi:hypothetical protein